MKYTHNVAVIAYIFEEGRFLLLKRDTAPFIWAPPGGRLKKDEDPSRGLQREVKEETNLDIEIIAPANTWFGKWNDDQYLLSIDYIVRVVGGKLQLSPEHSDFVWVSLKELRRGVPIQLKADIGFQLKDFEHAYKMIDTFGKKKP